MKQTSMSYMMALAGALLAGQVCHAVPTSGDVTGIAARDEAAPVPGLYGDSGRPEIDDLVKPTCFCPIIRDATLDVFNHVLLGFLKCNAAWVETWFPDSGELSDLKKSNTLAEGDGYFLKYNPVDGKRHAVAVTSHWDWAVKTLPPALLEGPWWPRAALQGAHDGKEMGELNITEITLAISGEKLVKTELENKDDYWNYIAEGHRTPVWVVLSDSTHWHVVMSTQGSGVVDGEVNTLHIAGEQSSEQHWRFWDKRSHILEVWHLEDLPSFVNGRKGDIAY